MRVKIVLLCAVAVVALIVAGQMSRDRGEALADPTPSKKVLDLVAEIQGGGPINRRLMALDQLRKLTDTGVESELEKIATGTDTALAAFATRALGRRKTGTAKSKLKGMVESGTLNKDLRMGAMSAIALHWKDDKDLDYLDAKSKNDADMKAHCGWLKTKVYKKK